MPKVGDRDGIYQGEETPPKGTIGVFGANLPYFPPVPEQYIMFRDDDEIDWGWTRHELHIFRKLWNNGINLWDIAKEMQRDPDEILLLAVDQARQKKIRRRAGWIWGSENAHSR